MKSIVIALDTNLLVYAHRADMPFHAAARAAVESLATTSGAWAIPWPCVHEFIAVVTNPRIFKTPTPIATAFRQLADINEQSSVRFIAEGDAYLPQLEQLAVPAKVQGGAIHDARIAAICLFHGVSELWSADRDFSRFALLRTRNPLIE